MAQKYTTNIQRIIPQIHIKYETGTSVSTRDSYQSVQFCTLQIGSFLQTPPENQ